MDEFDTEREMLIEQHMQEMNDLQVSPEDGLLV